MSTTATTAAHTLTRRNFPAETRILTTGGDVYFGARALLYLLLRIDEDAKSRAQSIVTCVKVHALRGNPLPTSPSISSWALYK